MECLAYCLGDKLDLTALDKSLKVKDIGTTHRVRYFLRLLPRFLQGTAVFFFPNGTFVTWNIKRHQMGQFLDIVKPHISEPYQWVSKDEITYKFGEETAIEPHDFFDVDRLTLAKDCLDLKLSIAYGLSQSIKLNAYEARLDNLILRYSPYMKGLRQSGHMPLNRRQIQQVIGELLSAKNEMNLQSDFMSTPKFFWQHPSLEVHFTMMERYMDIERRINALNHRLNTLGEIFNIFQAYQDNKHSHHLEIIIIVLIAIEIVFGVLNFHF